MLDIARGKAASAGVSNVDFEQGTVEELSLPEASFDVVLVLSLLHLVEDRDTLLATAHRLQKPGGVFVSSTACLGSGMRFLRWILPIGRSVGLLPLVRFFTRDELRASVEGAGFAIEHEWQPSPKAAVFVVATKQET